MSYQAFFTNIISVNGNVPLSLPSFSLSGSVVVYSAYDGNGIISGTVKNVGSPGIPVYRKVRLHEKSTGFLVREVWSDPVTGVYTFKNISMSYGYYICSFDHTGKYNGVIADPIYASLPS